MHQLPLPFTRDAHDDEHDDLAGVMPAMRRAAGAPEGEGRKALPDIINAIAQHHEVRVTTGNTHEVKQPTVDKWMSASDTSHPPSIMAVIVFCRATKDVRPLLVVLLGLGRELATKLVLEAAKRLGLRIMTDDDRRDVAYGRACRKEHEAKKAGLAARRQKARLEEEM